MKAAFFPGQGSQFVGMARDIYEASALARDRYQRAGDILGFSLSDVCFNGPESELVRTSRAQPALYVHSLIVWELWGGARPSFDFVAGHSLGEFSALAAVGVFNFEAGLKLVQARATAMQHACDLAPGSMAALLQLPTDKLDSLLAEGQKHGRVVAANFNSEAQIVVSGDPAAVERVVACAGEFGARKAIPLKVGGAFHSPLMQPAREELARALDRVDMQAPACQVVMNVTAAPTRDPDTIRQKLEEQLVSPVRWWQALQFLGTQGLDAAFEIGAGQVLKGLAKRALPNTEVTGIATWAELEAVASRAQVIL